MSAAANISVSRTSSRRPGATTAGHRASRRWRHSSRILGKRRPPPSRHSPPIDLYPPMDPSPPVGPSHIPAAHIYVARSYRSSTLDPRINKLWFERYPGLAVQIKAVITHRAAVSTELMMIIARTARTSQSSHDLEAALKEFRSIQVACLPCPLVHQCNLLVQPSSRGLVASPCVGVPRCLPSCAYRFAQPLLVPPL